MTRIETALAAYTAARADAARADAAAAAAIVAVDAAYVAVGRAYAALAAARATKFTISARRGDQFIGDDETHVGTYAGKLLTQAEADEAIADLLASQPEGWDDVGYTADAK